ncbi:CsgG/HfaB family protein [Rubrivivax sp. A210]|uniref:CsgG/HfaB family protein n=1 Tax=Rubrivivax sp. A210 TaxID=2772301 RepID=UPI00191899E1|nr:CsgG/HfaB family protein [Rubrivivax sp. A210]
MKTRLRGPVSALPALATLAAALLLPGAPARALEGQLVQARGEVRIAGQPAAAGARLAAATLLSTGSEGRAQLRLADGAVISLPPASELRLAAGDAAQLTLVKGGLRLSPSLAAPAKAWRIELADRSIRTNGFLTLQTCAAGCALAPGLYGSITQGEAVLEYQGGRSVLKSRSFRWVDAKSRPEVLVAAPALLDDSSSQADGLRARAEAAKALAAALADFNAGLDAQALAGLGAVQNLTPGEPLLPYYQGLIALRRDDNASALRLLQQYAREDPEGAATREVPKTLTLLASDQLQKEVAVAVAREKETVATPPEPGSIAVQAFVNKGADDYRAMAKGLAAMIIADLSKVPGLKVLEREKVQVLVDEAKLGDSGLADTASAVRSGRLMRAEKVVVGNFEVQ